MIPALVANRGNTFNKTAGTTLALTTTGTITAGNLIVACVLFDNFTTASKPIVSSIGKMAGETNNWVSLGRALSTSTSGGAFGSGELMCIQTTVDWSAAAYTVTLDSSVTMKSVLFMEFSGVTASVRSTAGTNYSTTTTAASAATTGTTPVINDLTVGFIFQSNSATAPASDTDTSAGSWSTAVGTGSTGASAASNNFGIFQYKVLTAATAQTLNSSTALTAGNGAIVAILQSIPDPAITQAAYRFYDETGTESGSTALAAQDTALGATLTGADGFGHLRIRLQSTTAVAVPGTDEFQLQWEKNASGSWTNVTTGGSTVLGYDSASLTSGAGTTNRLGAGTGSFVTGKVSETGLVGPLGWAANNYTELLYSLTLRQADLANGDTLRFRVLRNGATTGMTYTATPTINLTIPATGQAVRFDGSGDHYSRTGAGAQTVFTMCAWVYPISTGTTQIVGFDNNSDYNYLALSSTNQFQFWQPAGTTTSSVISANSWAFVAVSYNNAGTRTMYLWKNGDSAFTTTNVTVADGGLNTADTFVICGDNSVTFPLNGRVAAVKIWLAALTQPELLSELQSNQAAVRTANLWAFYSFTQGPSTFDNSGNGRTLTAAGALTAEAGPPVLILGGVPVTPAMYPRIPT